MGTGTLVAGKDGKQGAWTGQGELKQPERQTAKPQTGGQLESGGSSCHQHLKPQREEREACGAAWACESWGKAADGEKQPGTYRKAGAGSRGCASGLTLFPQTKRCHRRLAPLTGCGPGPEACLGRRGWEGEKGQAPVTDARRKATSDAALPHGLR